MLTRRGIRLALALVAVAGCDPDDEDEQTCSTDILEGETEAPGALRVGHAGASAFTPIASGDSVELDMGNQGGWMVQPIARIDPDAIDGTACPRLVLSVQVEGDELPVTYDLRTPFHETGSSWSSDAVQLLLAFDVAEIAGRSATLTASVTDGDAIDTVTVEDLTLVDER